MFDVRVSMLVLFINKTLDEDNLGNIIEKYAVSINDRAMHIT